LPALRHDQSPLIDIFYIYEGNSSSHKLCGNYSIINVHALALDIFFRERRVYGKFSAVFDSRIFRLSTDKVTPLL
jgi:hypothetical protein